MAKVNLFLLLPETKPTNQWMKSIDLSETPIQNFKKIFESIIIEIYKGFYDPLNIKNFLCQYDTLDDYYPCPQKKLLQSIISMNALINWREEANQSPDTNYQIFSQPINDSTFCEIAERKNTVCDDKYALLNCHACTIKNMIVVSINEKSAIEIDNLKAEKDVLAWFVQNRIPSRNFNINPKHGENLQKVLKKDGEIISPLRCSRKRAQDLLDTAIGSHDKELYNFDPEYGEIIVFKYEGCTPQNMYHGYHVPKDSIEIPSNIRKRLNR